jgi:hypothetical protein
MGFKEDNNALKKILVQAEHPFRHVEHLFRKNTKSVQLKPESVFSFDQNRCSR